MQFELRQTEPVGTAPRFNLTEGNVSSEDSTIITITVSSDDLESIRLLPMLGYSVDTTFVAISEGSFVDMAGLQAVPRVLQASQNAADLVPPFLSRFSFDLNSGTLTLTFSENVTFSTLVISRVTLLGDNMMSAAENFTLGLNTTARDVDAPNGAEIELTLSPEELDDLKRLTMLATSPITTFVSLEANVVNDIAGNDAVPELEQMVADYIADTTRPQLMSFNLNFFTRELTLFFSETVNASSVDPVGIAFTNNDNTVYRLTDGTVLSDDGPEITFLLTVTDKNNIKALPDLAISEDSTFISLRTVAISDNAGNPVRRITVSSPMQVTEFVGDLDRPSLRSFDFDLNQGILTLHFNETVNVSSLFVERFTVQDNTTRVEVNHTFTDSTAQTTNAPDIVITLSIFDLNEIKRKRLCTSVDDCYLTFEDDAVQDMVQQSIDGVPDSEAVQVSVYINDTTRPKLAEFTRINLADGFITISFTETVNASSIDLTVITLMDLYDTHLTNYTLTGGSVTTPDSNVITFDLNPDDLRSIQADNFLCTHRGNCYIKFPESFAIDIAGNPVDAVFDEFPGFAVRNFGVDTLNPELLNFTINMNAGVLSLTFNEPVETDSLDTTGITIRGEQNTTDPVFFYRLTGGTTDSLDATIVDINLAVDDFNSLKASLFSKDAISTFITIEPGTITDNAFTPNQVMEIAADEALAVETYVEDDTSPELRMYTLDMDRDLLILTFNEPVDPNTVNCSEITLHNTSSTGGAELTLTGCNITSDTNLAGMLVITIQLTQEDITALKVNQRFAVSRDTVYLSFPNTTFSDTVENAVVPVSFRQASTFLPDLTRPSLLSFTYDQNVGQIILSFSDVVSAETFDATAITLQHDTDREGGRTFTPSSASTTSSPNGYTITTDLSHFDLLRLKSNTGVARSENDTYITIAAFLIEDTSQINIVPITDGRAIRTELFIPDNDPPALTNYTLDLNVGAITLTFSDTVNRTTFTPSGLVLQEVVNATAGNSTSVLRLMDGLFVRSENGLEITLTLDVDDLNELKRNTNLTTSAANTYLVVDEGSVQDLAGNDLVAVLDSEAVQPQVFREDETDAVLDGFDIDMNSGVITLTFVETVNAGSTVVSEFTLQNDQSAPSENYTISSAAGVSAENSTLVYIFLTQDDLNEINVRRQLVTGRSDTFLSISTLAVMDINSNPAMAIPITQALPVSNFTRDSTQPALLSFDLDLDSEVVTLRFSEVVDYASFNVSQLIFLSESSLSENLTTYRLTSGMVRPVDNHTLYLDLDVSDLNELKRLRNLAVSLNTTYLAFGSGLVMDTFGNDVENVTETEPERAAEYIRDTTPPTAIGFTLDINMDTLSLTFDETVNASSLVISSITIQSSLRSPVEFYILDMSSFSRNDSTILYVFLDQEDSDSIKLLTMLATSENNTFLSLTEGAVEDMSGNAFQGLNFSGEHLPDVTSPTLVSFTLDLNTDTLVLNFSEAVNTSSLNVTRFTLYSDSNTSLSREYRLTELTQLSQATNFNAKVFNVSISEEDLNTIKADTFLATAASDTFLLVDDGAIRDMADNDIQSLPEPVQVAEYVEDMVRPFLRRGTFNFNGGFLVLTFSETVNASTFDPTQITLQSGFSIIQPSEAVDITGGTFTMENSITVTLTLTEGDLNRIKNIPTLFTSADTTFLSFSNTTIQDMNGNYVVEISPNLAMVLFDFVPDAIAPEVESFDLDMNTGLLTITFSETIDTSSFSVDQLWLQNDQLNSSEVHQLTVLNRQVTWFVTYVDILLSDDNINAIKLLEGLATNNSTTYLRFINTTALDTAGNGLLELNDTEGIPVSVFTPDTTPPRLVDFDLDMDGTHFGGLPRPSISLYFSEPVRADSIQFEAITIQSAADVTNNDTQSYTLTTGNVTSDNGLRIDFDLLFIDYVSIQSMRVLAIDQLTSYISLLDEVALDMNFNPSSNVSDLNAVQVSIYDEDMTDPSLREFSIDLNVGLLALTFTEAMDSASVGRGRYLLLSEQAASVIGVNSIEFNGGLQTSPLDWYIINITFTETQLNDLRLHADRNVFTSNETSYLAITIPNLPTDTVQRAINFIADVDAVLTSEYTPDVTIPFVTRFEFDYSGVNGIITLDFSEPVNASSLEPTLLEFHNSAFNVTSNPVIPLRGGTSTSSNGLRIQLTLLQEDLNLLKSLTNIATDVNDTFIFLRSSAIADMYGNAVSDITGVTDQADEVVVDETNPELDAFSFDLNSGTLYLTFSETVNTSTLNTSELILQSAMMGSLSTFQLQGGDISLPNQPVVSINLTIEDLNAIKAIRDLATSASNLYLSAGEGTILDMVGLNLTEETGLEVTDFIQDTTSPELLSFRLNLTSEELTLTFDETISAIDTNLLLFTLQSEENSTSVTLSASSQVSVNDSTVIVVSLSTSDLNRIKLDTTLATNVDNTQLVLAAEAVRDMAMQPNVLQILDTDLFYPDLTPPNLEMFVFDLNTGLVRLIFDEAINTESLDITGLSFMEQPNGAVIFNLGSVNTNSTNGTLLDLYITDDDLNAIKRNTSLLTSMSTAYLALLPQFLADMNANLLNAVSGVQADLFINDTMRPSLVRFDLDLDSSQLTLVFSETVNASSFDPTGLTLQLEMDSQSPTAQHTLTGGDLLSLDDSTELTLVITNDDLNIIKARGIAQDNNTTFLLLSDLTVRDLSVFSRRNLPVANGPGAAAVNVYTDDETSPVLLNFTLNLSSETLELSFSETVDPTSFNTTQFTLQNTSGEPLVESRTLSTSSFTTSPPGPVISIQLSISDLNEIKRLVNLGTDTDNTFLSFTDLALSDTAGNPVEPQSTSNSLQANAVIEDISRPSLEDYDLSLNQGTLSLTFSETVRANSLIVTDIALQSQRSFSEDNGTFAYNLTGGTVLSGDGTIISVSLSQFDLNEIKHNNMLATGAGNVSSNTFLTLQATGLSDSNGNAVEGISPSNAREVSRYFSDLTAPELTNFNFDLNTGIITLIFDEAVNGSTLDPEGLTLYSINATNVTSYTLTNGTVIRVEQTYVDVQLSEYDLDNIKALADLATSTADSFLAITEGAIEDNDNNPVVEIQAEAAIAITNLTRDITRPELIGFDFDLDSGNLTLTFSETVLASSLQPSRITVQSSESQDLVALNSSLFYTLVFSENVTAIANRVLVLEIANSDLNEIKGRSRLATSESTTFLSLTENTVSDTSGNGVTEVLSTNATSISNYTSDASPPTLMSFNVDLDRGEITFRFSETVDNSTFRLTSYTLQDSCPQTTIMDLVGNGSNSSNSSDTTSPRSYTLTGN
jgi:hypothetical protein